MTIDDDSLERIKELNEQFVSYIADKCNLAKDKQILLDASAVQWYKRFRDEIKDDADRQSSKRSAPPQLVDAVPLPAPASPAPVISFTSKALEPSKAAADSSPASVPAFGTLPSPTAFSFDSTTPASATAPTFNFGGGAPPPFSFGALPAPATGLAAGSAPGFGAFSSVPGFSLFAPTVPPQGGPTSLSFGAPAQLKLGAEGGGVEDEEEEARPPSPSVVKGSADDDWEETIEQAKAKLFFMQKKGSDMAGEQTWNDRGVGVLQVRRAKEAKNGVKVARLVMRNDTGKIFLNASLYPGLKVQLKSGKNLIAMLANAAKEEKIPGAGSADAAGDNQMVLTMLRLANDGVAQKLRNAIVESVPSE